MRRIISLLLTLIIAMSFIPSVYAEDSGDVFEITHLGTDIYDNNFISGAMVQNLTSDTQTGVLVIATYSAEGIFLDFAYTDISVPPNTSSYHFVIFKSRPTAFQKAFIWNGFGTFKPLAETYYMELDKSEDIHVKMFDPQITIPNEKQFHANYPHICFDDGSLYVTLADLVDIYVNGALYTTISPEADLEEGLTNSQAILDAILPQAQGQVVFVRGNPEDFAFTEIHVTCYQVAEITTVDSNSSNTKISLQGIKGCIDTNSDSANWDYILIENDAVESGDVTVNVTRDGEECNLSSLKKGDIIAYAVDFKAENGLVNPEKIDIIAVSDSTISGKVTYVNLNNNQTPNDNIYSIRYERCEVIPGEASDPDICYGDSINVTLDPFNRIYDYEFPPNYTSFAVALKLGEDENSIDLLLSDGTNAIYNVNTTSATNFTNNFVLDKIDDEINIADRVVTCEISGRNRDILNIQKVAEDVTIVDKLYNERTCLLGTGNKILRKTPIILINTDAEGTTESNNADNYTVMERHDLVDGTEYSGHIYKIGTDVAFVVLTNIGITTTFHANSQFAVAVGTPADVLTEDGDKVRGVEVLYDGEVQYLYFVKTDSTSIADSLTPGDIFFFETNSDGYVEVVYEPPFEGNTAWEDKIKADDWSYNIWDENRQLQFAQGVVTEVTSNAISFATIEQVESGYLDVTQDLDDTHEDGIVSYGFADDCVAYTYDSGMKTRVETDKYDVTSSSSIKASDFSSFDNGNGVLNDGIYQGDLMSKATTATVMIVDGEVVAIFAYER